MQIGIDGGALCAPPGQQYGTYRFSMEFLQALIRYGSTQNTNTVYSFCKENHGLSGKNIRFASLPSFGWMSLGLPLELMVHKKDVFLGLNQVIPAGFRGKKIVVSHGLSFFSYPQYYKNDFNRLKQQFNAYTRQADYILVSSQKVKTEILEMSKVKPEQIVVLPFGIPQSYQTTEQKQRLPFFLYVGSDQPVKNIQLLIEAFRRFCVHYRGQPYTLVLVGTKLPLQEANIRQVPYAGIDQLKQLYQTATAYITTSYYESFNYPVVEALSQNCPVIGMNTALIPEQLPFVSAASTMDELVVYMKNAVNGAVQLNALEQVHAAFSWERYVTTLEALYAKL